MQTTNIDASDQLQWSRIQGMIKVYGGVLRPEIEYKTVAVSLRTTALVLSLVAVTGDVFVPSAWILIYRKELVSLVLEKYDCPTRDRNLYYIVMVTGKSTNGKSSLSLVVIIAPIWLSACLSVSLSLSVCLPVCLSV